MDRLMSFLSFLLGTNTLARVLGWFQPAKLVKLALDYDGPSLVEIFGPNPDCPHGDGCFDCASRRALLKTDFLPNVELVLAGIDPEKRKRNLATIDATTQMVVMVSALDESVTPSQCAERISSSFRAQLGNIANAIFTRNRDDIPSTVRGRSRLDIVMDMSGLTSAKTGQVKTH